MTAPLWRVVACQVDDGRVRFWASVHAAPPALTAADAVSVWATAHLYGKQARVIVRGDDGNESEWGVSK
jgi:hypothetical protein